VRRLAVVCSLVAVLGAHTASRAAVQVVVAPPGAFVAGVFDVVDVAVKGEPLTFVNLDPSTQGRHNVRSVAYGSNAKPWCSDYPLNKCPLFVSALVAVGGSSTADISATVAGQNYDFVCELHGNMKGTLRVVA
jgi:hypothetical protein